MGRTKGKNRKGDEGKAFREAGGGAAGKAAAAAMRESKQVGTRLTFFITRNISISVGLQLLCLAAMRACSRCFDSFDPAPVRERRFQS